MAQAPDLTAADVMALCESYMNEKHVAFVKKALDFATEAHKEQFRLSGEAKLLLAGFQTVALGPRILRAETAPIYFLSALSYALELEI